MHLIARLWLAMRRKMLDARVVNKDAPSTTYALMDVCALPVRITRLFMV